MLKFWIRKLRRRFGSWNWDWIGIFGVVALTFVLLFLFLTSSRDRDDAKFGTTVDVDTKLIVDQPLCRIYSFTPRVKEGMKMEGLTGLRKKRVPTYYTEVLPLEDGTNVVYKRTRVEDQACVTCCFKELLVKIPKSYAFSNSILPSDQLLESHSKYCQSFIRIAHFTSKRSNFLSTICSRRCGEERSEEIGDDLRLHPLLQSSTKVRLKVESWKRKRPLPPSIILLNFDSLSREWASELLPKTMGRLEDWVELKGQAMIGAHPISNLMASLTGLDQESWDEACGFSETGYFTNTCPFIWKDLAKAQYLTAYFGLPPSLEPVLRFVESPTNFFHDTDVYKLLNMSRVGWMEMLVDLTSQFNKKYSSFPTFSLTRFPSSASLLPSLDLLLSRLIPRLSQLPNTVLVLYSNSGNPSASEDPKLDPLRPLLFLRLSPEVGADTGFKSVLRQNSDRLSTPFDLYETFRHVLRLSCFPRVEFDYDNMTSECYQNILPLAGANSLFIPLSNYRSCDDARIPPEVCPCNRNLSSVDVEAKEDVNLGRTALAHLNSLVPKNDTCSHFILHGLRYTYPAADNGTELIVGISVKPEGGNSEMLLEQRVMLREGRRILLGLPRWTSELRPNGNLCLPFSTNPTLSFIHKLYCLCKTL